MGTPAVVVSEILVREANLLLGQVGNYHFLKLHTILPSFSVPEDP